MTKNKKRNGFYVLFFTALLLFCVVSITFTFAKLMYTTIMSDSAAVAKFDIDVIAPAEFDYASFENPFEHSFSGKDQSLIFHFEVTNNAEVDVICTPYFDNEVPYYILVDEIVHENFNLDIGETVSFQVVVLADGLGVEATLSNLILEIEQRSERRIQ